MSRSVAACDLSPGMVSRPFTLQELAAAASRPPHIVYVEVDGGGRVECTGGVGGAGGAGGAARAAVGARLAPHVAACSALLEPAGTTGTTGTTGALRLRLVAGVERGGDLLLWFHEDLLALVDMPFLTLRNILGEQEYRCHECGAKFEQPNPLKLHLFLGCAPPRPQALWRRALPLLAPPTPRGAALAPREAALDPHSDPARLEALAAEWGRAAGGHVCLYCGKLYSRKYGLKIHIRTHTGYRPLRCGHCARAFGDPSNLNKHLRLHRAAGGPLARTLARRRDLARHVRARHPRTQLAAGAKHELASPET